MAEARIVAWLAAQEAAMIDLLREIVNIDSGSYNKPGVDAVGAVLRRFLESHGIGVATLPQAKRRYQQLTFSLHAFRPTWRGEASGAAFWQPVKLRSWRRIFRTLNWSRPSPARRSMPPVPTWLWSAIRFRCRVEDCPSQSCG